MKNSDRPCRCRSAAMARARSRPTPRRRRLHVTFNVGAVTDYRYRGISQTRQKPALQGGFDFAR